MEVFLCSGTQQYLVNNNQLFEQEGLRTRDEEDIIEDNEGRRHEE
jgi:hypothetical protein